MIIWKIIVLCMIVPVLLFFLVVMWAMIRASFQVPSYRPKEESPHRYIRFTPVENNVPYQTDGEVLNEWLIENFNKDDMSKKTATEIIEAVFGINDEFPYHYEISIGVPEDEFPDEEEKTVFLSGGTLPQKGRTYNYMGREINIYKITSYPFVAKVFLKESCFKNGKWVFEMDNVPLCSVTRQLEVYCETIGLGVDYAARIDENCIESVIIEKRK